ncbi:ABC transporter substrate-binding protein [Actinomadura napierensis]|uniref:ABC transporter substrate-binding protein n=1 Tax=Actinomadura napierensis TaxID=267854 RepID=A0ABN2ZLA2_9ACTN
MSGLIGRLRGRGRPPFAALAAGLGLAALSLSACGGGDAPPANVVATGSAPSYYPADYAQVINASKGEGGTLTIYSNTDQENWAPIFHDFQKKYPWVKKISANNLDSDEVFQRVLSEQATSGSPADLLVSNAAQAWAEFAAKPNALMAYKSPELAKLPKFAQLLPNVYAMSVDPLSAVYNKTLIDQQPDTLQGLADLVAKDQGKYRDKITTRDVKGSFGFTVSHAFTSARPGSWAALQKILPLARPETSSGTQLEKITSGEYVAGFFISAAPAYPVAAKSGGLLKITFLKDGTVVLPRGVGIAAKAPHPATSKLFADFLMSQEGQRAVAEGGLTSYRGDVETRKDRHTYQELVSKVGESNVIFARYAEVPGAEVNAFVSRWNGLLGH